jgi:hypothetical protein
MNLSCNREKQSLIFRPLTYLTLPADISPLFSDIELSGYEVAVWPEGNG